MHAFMIIIQTIFIIFFLNKRVKDQRHSVKESLVVYIVNVIDETPAIEKLNYLFMPEELPNGTSLSGFYQTSDRDVNDTLTYSITGRL